MGLISRPNTFTAGTPAIASQVNDNENTIYNEFNGNIDNNNIKASAGIEDTKLAQITTASKVSTIAITGTFSNIVSTTMTSTTLSVTTITATTLNSVTVSSTNLIGQNIQTVGWTDYSATSTVIGWSSMTSKEIYTKKIGKKVFVQFNLAGTSNTNTISFTLPYISTSVPGSNYTCCLTTDNSTTTSTGGLCALNGNSTSTNIYKDMAATLTFTNSGSKVASGQFFYEEA